MYIVVFFYIWVYKPTYHKLRGSTEKQKHRSREGNTKSKKVDRGKKQLLNKWLPHIKNHACPTDPMDQPP